MWLQVIVVISSVVQMAVDQRYPIEVSVTVEMIFYQPCLVQKLLATCGQGVLEIRLVKGRNQAF